MSIDGRPIALCWLHDEPLVMSFIVPKKEFVCMRCGGVYEFFGPRKGKPTPTRLAKSKKRNAEFRKLTAGFIAPRSWHKRCKKCFGPEGMGTTHLEHATPRQLAADKAARVRIIKRLPALEDWL